MKTKGDGGGLAGLAGLSDSNEAFIRVHELETAAARKISGRQHCSRGIGGNSERGVGVAKRKRDED